MLSDAPLSEDLVRDIVRETLGRNGAVQIRNWHVPQASDVVVAVEASRRTTRTQLNPRLVRRADLRVACRRRGGALNGSTSSAKPNVGWPSGQPGTRLRGQPAEPKLARSIPAANSPYTMPICLDRPALKPPSATIDAPVTNDASSLIKKAATAATSAGWPIRPIACSLSANPRAAGSAR
jgi:hypothetical protein